MLASQSGRAPGTKRGLGLGARDTFVLEVAFGVTILLMEGSLDVLGGAVGGLGHGHLPTGQEASRSHQRSNQCQILKKLASLFLL